FGACLVEDRDHVEPGQPDPLVVIGDPRGELVFFLVAEDSGRVMNCPQWHDSSVLLGGVGQWAKAKVRRSTGPDSAALTLMVMSSVSTSAAPSSSPSTMRLATSAGIIFLCSNGQLVGFGALGRSKPRSVTQHCGQYFRLVLARAPRSAAGT